MKKLGLILIASGLIIIIIRAFTVVAQKSMVDIDTLHTDKTGNKWIGWPVCVGAAVSIIGTIAVISDRNKNYNRIK
jgi:hypothetical protein